MADLVNQTHKERLAKRDSEPTHLNVGGYDDLGGTTIDAEPNSVKINSGMGVKGQDTSIIGAGQLSEPSHLKTEDDKGDVEVSFDGDDDTDGDDIDKELDEYEDVEPVDVDVDMDDEDGKKNMKEDVDPERGENEAGIESNMKEPEEVMNSGKNKVTGTNEDEDLDHSEVVSADRSVMDSGPNKVTAEGELPPWLSKFKSKGKNVKEDEIVIKKSGDEDDDEGKPIDVPEEKEAAGMDEDEMSDIEKDNRNRKT